MYNAKSTRPSAKREVQKEWSAKRFAREARDENVPAKQADFFNWFLSSKIGKFFDTVTNFWLTWNRRQINIEVIKGRIEKYTGKKIWLNQQNFCWFNHSILLYG